MNIVQAAHKSAGKYRENWHEFEKTFEQHLDIYWGAVDGFKAKQFGLAIGCNNGDLVAFVGSKYGPEAAKLVKKLMEDL